MKNIIFKILLLCGILLPMSCSDFLDVNKDISNPQTAQSLSLLPPMFADMARGEQFDARFVGQYTQYWAAAAAGSVWDAHGFASNNDAGGEKWRSHYFGLGKNVELMYEEATQTGKTDYAGVARAIWGWSWQTSTDHHGDMIVKQIFEPGRFIFDFDPQEEAYKEAEKACNEALSLFERPGPAASVASLSRGDLVYRGDASRWVKFTNGVLARLANHISNKSTYNPRKVIELVDKSLASNADNFLVPLNGTSLTDANFYGPLRNNMAGFRQSRYIVQLLDSVLYPQRDPRRAFMLTPSLDGVYRGVPPGSGDATATAAVTSPTRVPFLWGANERPTTKGTKYVFRDDAPYPIMTYFEMQFIKAEAAFRANDRAMALDAYRKAIIAHMDYCTVPAAQRDRHMSSNAVVQNAADLTLSEIMMQKYIALWAIGSAETWVDLRRYAYNPEIYRGFARPTNLSAVNNGKLAQRVRPRFNSEYVWNFASLQRIGADKDEYHTVEMWFSLP
jgi:Starch-binding associating with outer membrane